MADSLFDGNQPSITREEIIAKWKDKPREDLENAKAESDLYIKTLEARLDDISKDLLAKDDQVKTGAQIQALLDRLDKRDTEVNLPVNTDLGNNQPGIKPEDIERLVQEKMTAHQRQLKQNENFQSMQAKLRESFGDNYQATYKQRLDTAGLTPEFADTLARDHPIVFMKTLGLDQQQQVQNTSLPRSSVRQTSFAPQTNKRDWNFYQEMKKTNPRMYLDPKIAVQMHEDAMALGSAFGMPED